MLNVNRSSGGDSLVRIVLGCVMSQMSGRYGWWSLSPWYKLISTISASVRIRVGMTSRKKSPSATVHSRMCGRTVASSSRRAGPLASDLAENRDPVRVSASEPVKTRDMMLVKVSAVLYSRFSTDLDKLWI